jgi:RHS repeat-associated protein
VRSSARPEADLLAVPRAFRTIARGPGGEDPADWDLVQTREHNKANEIADTDNPPNGESITEVQGNAMWLDPLHDKAGNMTYGPRPDGEATAAEGLLTVYDAWNRLVEVWKDNGGATPDKQLVKTGDNKDTLLVKYQYDGLNRRIAKLLPSGESNWARTDYYYNESWQCLEERAETVAGEATPADEDHVKVQYVWDLRYIDAPVLRWRDTGGDPDLDETLYYCNDANMNVTALVEPDGDVAERYVYDPYGSLVHDANGNLLVHSADWSSTVTWPNSRKNEILFGGYRLDPETALYHVRHRQYHPTLGRWLQRDPIGYLDGTNQYQYVHGAPTVWLDPFGLSVNIVSHNKYPDDVSPVAGLGGYAGLGISIEGRLVTHYEDCCTEDDKLVEKGYQKITLELKVHAGLGIGAEAGGIDATAKGAGISAEYEFSSETGTCGQPPTRYTYSRDENIIDARVDLSVQIGPFMASFVGGTRVYLRLKGAIGGGDPTVFECDIGFDSGGSASAQAGNRKAEDEGGEGASIPIVRYRH